MSLKRLVYRLSKSAGLFALARQLTRRDLRILCYHGSSLDDEAAFSPTMFIGARTFARRLALLKRGGHPVLALDEAVQRLQAGTLPSCAVVITLDDGFFSTFAVAAPLLEAAGFPATLYVTSYYVKHEVPIFRLALQYALWKTKRQTLRLSELGLAPGLAIPGEIDLRPHGARAALAWQLINHGEALGSEDERQELLRRSCAALGVDSEALRSSRKLSLMNLRELQSLRLLDVQLHTHRHRFPADPALIGRELGENRAALAAAARTPLEHFCFPSGYFAGSSFDDVLRAHGIRTATTCETGLNAAGANPLALRRFLDSEVVSELEFEAELSGFAELLRRARTLLRGASPTVSATAEEARRGYPAGDGRSIGERIEREPGEASGAPA
jgi:peptidoglycan/xylan/chitin deacetylase (PgdA/CDA1 family)